MIRRETIFNTMVAIGVAYLGFLFYHVAQRVGTDGTFVRGASATAKGNVTAGHAGAPFLPEPTSSAGENFALLSLSNVLSASKIAFGFTVSSLSYLVYLPQLVYIPTKHAISVFVYFAMLVLVPLRPILVPIYFACRVIFTPLLVPLLLLYRFAVLVYPLYVFLGAAVTCGAVAGILARQLGKTFIKDVLGVRSRPQIESGGVKEASPRQAARRRLRD